MSDRDDLAALVASRRGVTARVNDVDREVADRILAAGWRAPTVSARLACAVTLCRADWTLPLATPETDVSQESPS